MPRKFLSIIHKFVASLIAGRLDARFCEPHNPYYKFYSSLPRRLSKYLEIDTVLSLDQIKELFRKFPYDQAFAQDQIVGALFCSALGERLDFLADYPAQISPALRSDIQKIYKRILKLASGVGEEKAAKQDAFDELCWKIIERNPRAFSKDNIPHLKEENTNALILRTLAILLGLNEIVPRGAMAAELVNAAGIELSLGVIDEKEEEEKQYTVEQYLWSDNFKDNIQLVIDSYGSAIAAMQAKIQQCKGAVIHDFSAIEKQLSFLQHSVFTCHKLVEQGYGNLNGQYPRHKRASSCDAKIWLIDAKRKILDQFKGHIRLMESQVFQAREACCARSKIINILQGLIAIAKAEETKSKDITPNYIVQKMRGIAEQDWLNNLFLDFVKRFGPGNVPKLMEKWDGEIARIVPQIKGQDIYCETVAVTLRGMLQKFAEQRCDGQGNIAVWIRFTNNDIKISQGALFDDSNCGEQVATTLKHLDGTVFTSQPPTYFPCICDGHRKLYSLHSLSKASLKSPVQRSKQRTVFLKQRATEMLDIERSRLKISGREIEDKEKTRVFQAALTDGTLTKNEIVQKVLSHIDQDTMLFAAARNLEKKLQRNGGLPTKVISHGLHSKNTGPDLDLIDIMPLSEDRVLINFEKSLGIVSPSQLQRLTSFEGVSQEDAVSSTTPVKISPVCVDGIPAARASVECVTYKIAARAASSLHEAGIDVFASVPPALAIDISVDDALERLLDCVKKHGDKKEVLRKVAALMKSGYSVPSQQESQQGAFIDSLLETAIRYTKRFDSSSIDELFSVYDAIENFCIKPSSDAELVTPNVKRFFAAVKRVARKTVFSKNNLSDDLSLDFGLANELILSELISGNIDLSTAKTKYARFIEQGIFISSEYKSPGQLALMQQEWLSEAILNLSQKDALTAQAYEYLGYITCKAAEHGLNREYVESYRVANVCEAVKSELKKYLVSLSFWAFGRKRRVKALLQKLRPKSFQTLPQLYTLIHGEIRGIFSDLKADKAQNIANKKVYFDVLNNRCLPLIRAMCSKHEIEKCYVEYIFTRDYVQHIVSERAKGKEKADKDGKLLLSMLGAVVKTCSQSYLQSGIDSSEKKKEWYQQLRLDYQQLRLDRFSPVEFLDLYHSLSGNIADQEGDGVLKRILHDRVMKALIMPGLEEGEKVSASWLKQMRGNEEVRKIFNIKEPSCPITPSRNSVAVVVGEGNAAKQKRQEPEEIKKIGSEPRANAPQFLLQSTLFPIIPRRHSVAVVGEGDAAKQKRQEEIKKLGNELRAAAAACCSRKPAERGRSRSGSMIALSYNPRKENESQFLSQTPGALISQTPGTLFAKIAKKKLSHPSFGSPLAALPENESSPLVPAQSVQQQL